MKKIKANKLNLNKQTVSNLNLAKVYGGKTDAPTQKAGCVTAPNVTCNGCNTQSKNFCPTQSCVYTFCDSHSNPVTQ